MLKVGNCVLIKKPKDINEPPRWVPNMNKFDNTYQIVSSIRKAFSYNGYVFKIKDDNNMFSFNPKWAHDKFEEHKRRLLSV